ncbi:hypothetical protein SAFG77S_07226 [Streptomyces afghaniensis]|jgi:hypothetical protein
MNYIFQKYEKIRGMESFPFLLACRQKDIGEVKMHFHALLGVEGVRLLWD